MQGNAGFGVESLKRPPGELGIQLDGYPPLLSDGKALPNHNVYLWWGVGINLSAETIHIIESLAQSHVLSGPHSSV